MILTPWYLKQEDDEIEFSYYRYEISDTLFKVPIVTVRKTIKVPYEYIARFRPFQINSNGFVTPNWKTSTRLVFQDLETAKSSIDEYAKSHGYAILTDKQYHKIKCLI